MLVIADSISTYILIKAGKAKLFCGAGLILHLYFNILPPLIGKTENRFFLDLGIWAIVFGYPISLFLLRNRCLWLDRNIKIEKVCKGNEC